MTMTRLQQLLPLLACPACRGYLEPRAERLHCQGCAASYRIRHGVPVLLCAGDGPDDIEVTAGETPESKHPYGPRSEEIIAAHAHGWVLDLGSGAKLDRRDHVVQMDIFRYPMVDVVGSATTLPFRDNAFDAVISQAVFEHLQYPEQAAAEIRRVLKPHGVLKIDTAFLQPEHGYPHHYFNATERGLRHWFRDFDIEWSGVEAYQHPLWALSWFLDLYQHHLPPDSAATLRGLTIEELLGALARLGKDAGTAADQQLFQVLEALPPAAQRALASGVTVRGKNPAKSAAASRPAMHARSDSPPERRLMLAQNDLEREREQRRSQSEYHTLLEDQARYLMRFYPGIAAGLSWKAWLLRSAAAVARNVLPPPWWFALRRRYLARSSAPLPRVSPTQAQPFVTFVLTPVQVAATILAFFSLARQSYSAWQLVLLETPAQGPDIRRVIHDLCTLDERVMVCRDSVASMVQGTFCAVLQPDSTLDFAAVEEFVTLFQDRPNTTQIRCDHDRRVNDGRYFCCIHGPTGATHVAAPEADGGLLLRRSHFDSASHADELAYIDKVLLHRHPNLWQFR